MRSSCCRKLLNSKGEDNQHTDGAQAGGQCGAKHANWFGGILIDRADWIFSVNPLRSLQVVLLIAVAIGTVFAAAAADRSEFTNLAKARYVHCAFYKSYETDPATGDPIMVEGKADALMHFQGIDVKQQKAHAIYTRMSGLRNVTVIQTDKAIHFVDSVAGMYVMTTVYSCIDFDEKRGICVTYGAVNSRLFDSSVLSDPDKVYEKIKNGADPGFCDHSYVGIQEASQGAR